MNFAQFWGNNIWKQFILPEWVDEWFKKNKNPREHSEIKKKKKTHNWEVEAFLLIKISSSYGLLYTQVPVKKDLQDQACTEQKYTFITSH